MLIDKIDMIDSRIAVQVIELDLAYNQLKELANIQ